MRAISTIATLGEMVVELSKFVMEDGVARA
jgi:hypothetical protein